MKHIILFFSLSFILLSASGLYAQVGINTTEPDASAALDITSKKQGFLMPRLTSVERDNITTPAAGLMIYNKTINDTQINLGTPLAPKWKGNRPDGPYSITNSLPISTILNSDESIPDMIFTPSPGTYLAFFNAKMSSGNTQEFTSDQAILDVKSLYTELKGIPTTEIHALVFGLGETLQPGVYDVAAGAPSISGTLKMDGGSLIENPIFIIRGGGAFSTAAGATLELIGNAKPENIFFVTDGAPTLGANTTLSGTLIHGSAAAGAPAMGANSTLVGRLFTTLGAASVAAGCTLSAPGGVDPYSLGVLETFAMWTSDGAISSAADSVINGDVGTGAGAVSGMAGTVNGQIFQPGTTGTTNSPTDSTFSIFKNGTLVQNSSRVIDVASTIVSLQAVFTIDELSVSGTPDTIEVRWKVADGELVLENRIFSLVRIGY